MAKKGKQDEARAKKTPQAESPMTAKPPKTAESLKKTAHLPKPVTKTETAEPVTSTAGQPKKSSLKTKAKTTYKHTMAAMTVIATLGGTYGVYRIMTGGNKSAQQGGLTGDSQEKLLQMVADGTISPEQAVSLARSMTGKAFPEEVAGQPVQTENALGTPQERYSNTVIELALSPENAKRTALVLIASPDTIKQGLDMLASTAKTAKDWREVGELAAPWDVKRAITAYEHATKLNHTDTDTLVYLSRLYQKSGDLPSASKTARAALSSTKDDRKRSIALDTLGDIAKAQGDLAAARAYYQDALTIAKALSATDPSNTEYQRDLSVSYDSLGYIAVAQGDLAAARAYYQSGLAIAKTLTAGDTSETEFQRDLSISYDNLGDIAKAQGDLAAARAYYQDGLVIAKVLSTGDASNTGFQRDLSISYDKLGDIAKDQGDLAAARVYYQDQLAITKTLSASDASNIELQQDLMVSYVKLASLGGDQEQKNWNRAYRILKALDDQGKMLPSDKDRLDFLAAKAKIE